METPFSLVSRVNTKIIRKKIPLLLDENGGNNMFCTDAIRINDNKETAVQEKEKLLTAHFKTQNIDVVFEGEYEQQK